MRTGKPQPIAEHEARGETVRIYHEIRQTLRVSGVNLNFRTWAAFPRFFPAMWASMQPLAAAQPFDAAGDALRARAADLALALAPLRVAARLGESQRYQLEQALALYHYVNPKLLLFTTLVRRGLTGEQPPSSASRAALTPLVPCGAPSNMPAMEMVDENPSDRRLRRLFGDIKKSLGLSSINSDYRTLAMWPDYLEAAWSALKRVVQSDAYGEATAVLSREASRAADAFSTPNGFDLARLKARGENAPMVLDVTTRFERLLPPLILNIALLARETWAEDHLRLSPFPTAARPFGDPGGAA